MTNDDRIAAASLVGLLRYSDIPGVDNVAEFLKERHLLFAFAKSCERSSDPDVAARAGAVVTATSAKVPNRW